MGTSVRALSELQLCFPYLSCPGNYIVEGSDLPLREFSDGGQGNCIQPPLMGRWGGRVRENESLLQTEIPLSPCIEYLFPNLEQVPRILSLSSAEQKNLFLMHLPGSWSSDSFQGDQ